MNDEKRPSRHANENGWYGLATLYGEQRKDEYFDEELANKNRIAWNRWVTRGWNDEDRAAATARGFAGLLPLSQDEEEEIRREFSARMASDSLSLMDLEADDPKINFAGVRFERPVSFAGYIFPYKTIFESSEFAQIATFSSSVFLGRAYFSQSKFWNFVWFNSALFNARTRFGFSEFLGGADFDGTTFNYTASFHSVVFSGPVHFESADFRDFSGFSSAKFSDSADFRSAKFSRSIGFEAAQFLAAAEFKSATFSEDAIFDSSIFSKRVSFSSARIQGALSFINAKFGEKTDFSFARFESKVPDFRGAVLHEATEWHGAVWPLPPTGEKEAQEQVYTYERLKLEMERLKKHEDEQIFFCKELYAKRSVVRKYTGGWYLNYMYQIISDYGQSVAKPIWLMAGIFFFGWVYFEHMAFSTGSDVSISRSALLSVANMFPFLVPKRELMESEFFLGLPTAAKLVGEVQSIFSAVLLFLLGLALRNRFRMK